jgi:2,3-bisphosphoglycerate-independent phosphoglycerate mutase
LRTIDRQIRKDCDAMTSHDLIRQLREKNKTKIVLLVADGLGGLPIEPGG